MVFKTFLFPKTFLFHKSLMFFGCREVGCSGENALAL